MDVAEITKLNIGLKTQLIMFQNEHHFCEVSSRRAPYA